VKIPNKEFHHSLPVCTNLCRKYGKVNVRCQQQQLPPKETHNLAQFPKCWLSQNFSKLSNNIQSQKKLWHININFVSLTYITTCSPIPNYVLSRICLVLYLNILHHVSSTYVCEYKFVWIFCHKKNFGGWLPLQVQKSWIVRIETKEPQSFRTTKRIPGKLGRTLHSTVLWHLHSVLINWNVTYRTMKRNAFRPQNRWLGKLGTLPKHLLIGGGSFVKSGQSHEYFQFASMLNGTHDYVTWQCITCYMWLDVLIVVAIEISVFWDVTSHSLREVHSGFRGTGWFHQLLRWCQQQATLKIPYTFTRLTPSHPRRQQSSC
jgi:hypothetical protein